MRAGCDFTLYLGDIFVPVHQRDFVFARHPDVHAMQLRKQPGRLDRAHDGIVARRLFRMTRARIMLFVERIEQERGGLAVCGVGWICNHAGSP